MHLKSCLRSPASRSVVSIRPWGGLLFSRAVGISTPGSISWWKPRYSSIFAAATLPAAMARMTVAGPVTQSPPAKTPSILSIWPLASATNAPRLMAIFVCSKPWVSTP